MYTSKSFVLLMLLICFSKAPAVEESMDDVTTLSPTIPGMPPVTSQDICNNNETDTQIHCFCDRGNPTEAKVQCWIFGGNLTTTYPYFQHFYHQPHVKSLQMIVKPYGRLNFLPRHLLHQLENLQKLEIIYATIDELPQHAFANMSALTHLKLERNQIGKLGNKAFVHLPQLGELSLDDNRIGEVQRGVFVDVPKLEKLFISKNNLSISHDRAFEHLGALEELDMSSNEISVLTRDTFYGLKVLRKLEMSFNKVAMLGDNTFSEMEMLEELFLESNLIQLITEKAFNDLGNLRKLNLKNNRISALSSSVFEDVPRLYFLNLKSNFLETIYFATVKPIYENFLNTSSYFLIDVNQFICDCRLVWLHRLYNETQNYSMKTQLTDVLCINQTDSTLSQGNPKAETTDLEETPISLSGETLEVEYEYEYYDESSSDTRRFLKIPLEELPCTPEQLATEDISQLINTPTKPTTLTSPLAFAPSSASNFRHVSNVSLIFFVLTSLCSFVFCIKCYILVL